MIRRTAAAPYRHHVLRSMTAPRRLMAQTRSNASSVISAARIASRRADTDVCVHDAMRPRRERGHRAVNSAPLDVRLKRDALAAC